MYCTESKSRALLVYQEMKAKFQNDVLSITFDSRALCSQQEQGRSQETADQVIMIPSLENLGKPIKFSIVLGSDDFVVVVVGDVFEVLLSYLIL